MNLRWTIILIFIGMSCADEKCAKNTGDQKTVKRTVPMFSFIKLYDNVDIILKKDSVYSIEISGGENLINFVDAEVQEGTLVIRNNNTCNWLRDYKSIQLTVSQPDPQAIFQFGSGRVSSNSPIQCNQLIIHQFGSGDIDLNILATNVILDMNGIGNVSLQGSCDYFSAIVYNPGGYRFGSLTATKLKAATAAVSSNTEADLRISADSLLTVDLLNTGNIYYKGNPVITKKRSGSGDLLKF